MNPATVWAIARKDLRQFFRDRTLVLFMLFVPLAQLVLLAVATGHRAGNLPLAVLDQDHSAQSRALIALLDASRTFEVTAYPDTWEAGVQLLDRGQVDALIVIPEGLAAELAVPGRGATVQLVADGSNNVVGALAVAGAGQAVERSVRQQLGALSAGVRVQAQMRYNPTGSSKMQTIPSQLGFIIYQVTLGVAALGLARERELGTLEQLMVTPVRRTELLLGKAIPPWMIGMLNFFLMQAVARYFFAIPLEGSLLFLLAGTLVFTGVEIVWGMMISALAANQQQATLLVFIQAVVDVALSGYIVPVNDMPPVLRAVAQVVPLHHYLVFVRSVMLKGAGLAVLWPRLAVMAGLGLLMGVLATRFIARRLD